LEAPILVKLTEQKADDDQTDQALGPPQLARENAPMPIDWTIVGLIGLALLCCATTVAALRSVDARVRH
jgi:hypothetical protein